MSGGARTAADFQQLTEIILKLITLNSIAAEKTHAQVSQANARPIAPGISIEGLVSFFETLALQQPSSHEPSTTFLGASQNPSGSNNDSNHSNPQAS